MTYKPDQRTITHLRYLEAESIHIIREVAAELTTLSCSTPSEKTLQ